jgi:hypothetical protein
MIVNGKTTIVVNGRPTRVCGRNFNEALRRTAGEPIVLDTEGRRLIPSKGLAWSAVAALVRAGKSVQAKAA